VLAFVISHGRSGSTLVHELLARHPEVGFVSNLEDRIPWLPAGAGRFNSSLYRHVPPALTRKGRLRYAPSEAWRVLGREVSPMLVRSPRDLLAADATPWVAGRFRRFFGERAKAQAKPVFLHKLTGWPRSGFIRAVFPDARFIHVVRDGRAVAASDLRLPWWRGWAGPHHMGCGPLSEADLAEWDASGRSFALLAGLSWKIEMDAVVAARELVPADQWLDVRYEDLLDDPPTHFKSMLAFLGLEAHPEFDAALARTDFRVDRKGAFRSQLHPADVAALDASLATQLRRWGYA
jgi:sulfotransferase family protein